MPSTRLLTIGNRLVVQPGRSRLMLSDASCCCGGCPFWTRIVSCDSGPNCVGTPSPVIEAWICASVRCIDGRPLVPPLVFLLDGLCWHAELEQQATPPPGAIVVAGLDPVQCVTGCLDPVCPQGELWLFGTPCATGNPTVYFCGVTECGIYRAVQGGCYRVDPAGGYIPGPGLPSGALTSPNTGRFVDCCDCEAGCVRCPLVTGTPNNPACYPADLFDRTCCRSNNSCTHIVRYRATQQQLGVPNGPVTIVNEAIDPQTGTNGEESWMIRQTFTQGIDPPIVTLLGRRVLAGCGVCPSWSARAPRDGLDTSFSGFTYADECVGLTGNPSMTVSGWNNNIWACDRQRQDVTYDYQDVTTGRRFITRFEFEATATDSDGGVCNGRCSGRAVSAEQRAVSGCEGCGGSQERTPV